MVVGGVVAVLIIIAIAAFVLLGSQKVITYKSSDLETSIAGSYNVKHPKQWQDYTDDKDALSAFGSLDEIDDYRVFAYGYDKDLGAVQAGILSGTIDFPVSDSEMTQILAAPGGKEQIEPAMKKAFAELAEGECKAISGKEPTFNYESDTYVMEIKASYECTYSEADRDKKLSDKNYLSIFIGLKGEKLYIVNVGAIDLDWAKNQNFYESVLSPSIQPK